MRVEASQFDVNSIVVKKDDLLEIAPSVEAQGMETVDLSEISEIDMESHGFVTVRNHQEAMLKAIDDKVYNESLKDEMMELQTLCMEVATAITEESYLEMQRQGIDPTKITPYELKCNLSEHFLKEEVPSEHDLDQESKNKIKKAMELSKSTESLSMDQIYSLTKSGKQPTIENIYKEQHMPPLTGAHHQRELDEKEWKQLKPYAEKAIKEAGYDVNPESLEIAKNLIEREIPVAKENITQVYKLKELKDQYSEEAIYPRVVESVRNGQDPITTNVIASTREDAENVVRKLESIKKESIVSVCKKGQPLTIKNLYEEQRVIEAGQAETQIEMEQLIPELDQTTANEEDSNNQNPTHKGDEFSYEQLTEKEITAKRQLEEIRLKMTLDASVKLLKKGIEVETEELSRVVDELRRLETEHYKEVLKSCEVSASDENVAILSETSHMLQQLATTPSYLIGQTYVTREIETLKTLTDKGTELKNLFIKANTAYEPLLTTPNAEYHDSIQKAFLQMDSLLEELQIDPTVENKRAVKILGYNEMDITKENIEGIKQYDAKLVTLIRNFKPFVTVEMIRQGLNPVDLPIDELNEKVTNILEEHKSTPEEGYAKFLYRLDQNKEIAPEDREAYIGVYRLLHQIEASDGKVLGRVLKAGQEITLKNMLTAARSIKSEKKEYIVDEDQGLLYTETKGDKDILAQINKGYEVGALKNESENISVLKNQLELLPTLNEELQEAFSTISDNGSYQEGVWDKLKELPLETLVKEFDTIIKGKKTGVFEAELRELKDILKNSDPALSFLHKLSIPTSVENLKYVSQMFGLYQTEYNKAKRSKNTEQKENLSILLKKMDKLSDTLVDKTEMQSAYDELERSVEEMLDGLTQSEHVDTESIRLFGNIHSQISFARRLSNKESFYIPIETENSVANMNVTILRNSVKEGKLYVNVNSEDYGTIRINMRLNKNKLTGHIEGDNRAVLSGLSREKNAIKEILSQDGVELKQLSYCFESHIGQKDSINLPDGKEARHQDGQTERMLYRLAKQMVKEVTKIYHELDKEKQI